MKYIAYCRKSSESEDRQAMSIESQMNELQKLAKGANFSFTKIFKESMSAKSIGRPVFEQMLEYIQKQNGCVLVAWKIDRISRNIADGGRVLDLLEKGKIKEIKTIDKTITNESTDKFLFIIDLGVGKKYIDDLRQNVMRGMKTKLEKGGWPWHAPIGYLNDGKGNIIVDSIRSLYVKEVFELYASGKYSLGDIVEIMNKKGLTTKNNKKVYRHTIYLTLQNPFYYGIMSVWGKIYEGSHMPIISKRLFDQVQDILHGNSRPRKKQHFFYLRGLMYCEKCGCMLTASKKKGHMYYYCTNGKKICDEHNKYMREEKASEKITDILGNIQFSSELVEIAYMAAKEKLEKNKTKINDLHLVYEKQFSQIKTKEDKLLEAYISELIDKDKYETKLEEIKKEKIDIKKRLSKCPKTHDPLSTLEQTKKIFLTANKAQKDFLEAKEPKRYKILHSLLWNLTFSRGEIANVKFKPVFELLANSPKNLSFSKMWAG
ncbi:recombinase family protein [Candidatus Parcubacteria bacterium]|nr:recombinase family protein [Candidatus Parcubacteria bacterium]